jgi:hypothetical protein
MCEEVNFLTFDTLISALRNHMWGAKVNVDMNFNNIS